MANVLGTAAGDNERAGLEGADLAQALFQPLERRRAFEEVIGEIENAIIEGRLKEGDRLPSERELAEHFKVGRPSVREALRVLEMFGVVSARRGTGAASGSMVTASTETGVVSALRLHSALTQIPQSDLIDLRDCIEAHNVRRAAERGASTAELRSLVDEMDAATEPDVFHQLDIGFHVAIARSSGNSLAPALMEALRQSMSREMLAGMAALEDWPGMRDRLIRAHREIVDRIDAGDADGAEAALHAHLGDFYRPEDGQAAAVDSQRADAAAL